MTKAGAKCGLPFLMVPVVSYGRAPQRMLKVPGAKCLVQFRNSYISTGARHLGALPGHGCFRPGPNAVPQPRCKRFFVEAARFLCNIAISGTKMMKVLVR